MTHYDYDLFVIGGGSGGVRAARVSASLGKKVGIAEEFRYGGTCVIRGCVPKKLYVYASQFSEHFEDAKGFGWSVGERSFDWKKLVAAKEAEITRLEGLYRKGLDNAKAEIFNSRAELVDAHSVRLIAEDRVVTAERIIIAVGGTPKVHEEIHGFDLAINSQDVFDLPELPKSIVIVGAGYIAVEFANILHGLGVEVTLLHRGTEILRGFDHDMREGLHKAMVEKGINILLVDEVSSIEAQNGQRLVKTKAGKELLVDQVMFAMGRQPYTKGLGLENVGVELGLYGEIKVNEYSQTNIPSIFALGDVTDRVQLTPVAIHEAMCFVESEFKNNPTSPDHDLIATAVFSQPEIGTVGMSEEEAVKQFTDLEVYRAEFRPMKATLSCRTEKMIMKLIVNAADRKVLGAHILGHEAGEMAQLLGVSLKAGATKDDFDRTMAVHPTAAEELVTMYSPSYRIKDGNRV